jgi:hypothetical protein
VKNTINKLMLADLARSGLDINDLAPDANAGNAEAEYLTAKALRYCTQTIKLYFSRSGGRIATLEEVQAQRARRPQGISPEALNDVDKRCRGFMEAPGLFAATGSWETWLDKAVDSGSPAAMAQKATILESDAFISSLSQLPHTPTEASDRDRAKELALAAAQSGDPDAIFLMADWVQEGTRSTQENAILVSAWQILGCRKGYDCRQDSDWMRSVCSADAQCANDQTYTDYFQRNLGTQYADALNLAKTIDQAILAKDIQGLLSHL